MATDEHGFASQASTGPATVVRALTVIMGAVVGLTFLFGFGNVLNLHSGSAYLCGLRRWWLLLWTCRSLDSFWPRGTSRSPARPGGAATCSPPAVLRECGHPRAECGGALPGRSVREGGFRRCGTPLVDRLVRGRSGPTAGDWRNEPCAGHPRGRPVRAGIPGGSDDGVLETKPQLDEDVSQHGAGQVVVGRTLRALLAQARREDAAHRVAHQKPISAETLRVGAPRARQLVKIVRYEFEGTMAALGPVGEATAETQGATSVAA
jgi:hypothetical protein